MRRRAFYRFHSSLMEPWDGSGQRRVITLELLGGWTEMDREGH